ncbi:Ig-like domain-containing protein [Bifidobacterium callimiconis]|uniref:Ig-like domain-containing protein n=1 Tax=Bifidobacterium callimiconis TaxID=2306973 RepID=UPI0013E08ABE|nr:Ig-like domain-containing protein [Bifidobacterium callimiconis]MBT1176683.1 Ig-like domain-containing protein [Bifidobacterium callimiconis]
MSDFNDGWKFHRGVSSGAQNPGFDDSTWREVRLPHDFGVEGPFSRLARSTVGFLRTGEGWYRKAFDTRPEWNGRRVSLNFDGVMELSEIWVNGTRIAEHHNGYAPFQVDITDALNLAGEPNVLAVHTNTPEPCSRWYPGAGLYRDVTLVVTDPVHVAHDGICISTPTLEQDVKRDLAEIHVETWPANHTDADVTATLLIEVIDGDTTVASNECSVTIAAGYKGTDDESPVRQLIMLNHPHLWSTNDPYRYTLRTSIIVDGSPIDQVETMFGLRWIGMSSETGLSLNGVRMKIAGMCMHHDLGALGAAVNRRAVVRQLKILKAAGVNAIRTAHNIGSKVQIEEASRMGFLVLEELADMWTAPKDRNDYSNYFLADSATDLKAMIGRDRNEPSVFMWSLGNEVAWQESELPLAEKLVSVAHAADPTRPVCVNDSSYLSKGIDGIGNDIHERMDVRGYSYASEDHLVAIHAKHPNDLIINSESGCSLGSRGYYVYPTDVPDGVRGTEFPFEPGRQPWDPDTYEITSYDITANRGTPIRKDFMRSMNLDFHMGEFTWTGFDYIGEPAPYIGNFYWNDPSQTESDGTVLAPKTAYYGIVDSAGFPKDEWYLYQSLWTDPDEAPMVHLLPHWNWRNGEPVQIWAYSNAAKVELFLNGRSLGVREFIPHQTGFHIDTAHPDKPFEYRFAKDDPRDSIYLHWNVDFEPGVVEAVAYNADGREVARDVVTTAGSPAAISLTADRHVLSADDRDLSFITADVIDSAGVICPDVDNQIVFTVENGTILGTDNGYQASTEAFQLPVRKAYHGKALAIVAPDGSGRPIRVHAKAAGLETGEAAVFIGGSNDINGATPADDRIPLTVRPVHVRTTVGTAPSLPDSVTAELANNTVAPVSVEWRGLDSADYRHPGIVHIEGVTADGLAAHATVTVAAPVAVVPYTTAVAADAEPLLPDTITVVYDDGSQRSEPVIWEQSNDADRSDDSPMTVVRGALDAPGSAEPLHAEAHIRTLSDGEKASSSVVLSDLRINGTTIDGFEPDTRRYALTLPYDAAAPIIDAESADNASIVVIPPVGGRSGEYLIDIASEDGTRGATVRVDVTIPPAPIATVVLTSDRATLVEDDTVTLTVHAVNALGEPIDADTLTYTVSDPAVGAVSGNVFEASLSGHAEIRVRAEYSGRSVESDPLTIDVAKGDRDKYVTDVDTTELRTEIGEPGRLPQTVRVHFDHGFDAVLPVTWQIPDDLWHTVGSHEVSGSVSGVRNVDGSAVHAKAVVTVVKVVAVEHVSTATVAGIAPDLTERAAVRVWWSDGLVEERDVTWREPDAASYAKPGEFTIIGDVDGVDEQAEATVRVTDRYAKNRDLFSFRNDVYPTVEASYTNTDPKVMEDVSNLMDGTVSYTARAGYNLKNRWSTFGNTEDTAWLEYRFGYGTETPFMLNAFTIYYCLEGEGVALPETVTVSAWDDGHWVPVGGLTTHDKPVEQQGSAGWIYGSFGDKTKSTKIDRGLERTYSFDMVKTSRIRIDFTSRPGECVAITEIRGDAQIAVVNEECALAGLLVDGVPVTGEDGSPFDPEHDSYVARHEAGAPLTVEPVPAGDNAAITVVPPADDADTVQVELVAENGVTKRLYTVRLV